MLFGCVSLPACLSVLQHADRTFGTPLHRSFCSLALFFSVVCSFYPLPFFSSTYLRSHLKCLSKWDTVFICGMWTYICNLWTSFPWWIINFVFSHSKPSRTERLLPGVSFFIHFSGLLRSISYVYFKNLHMVLSDPIITELGSKVCFVGKLTRSEIV